jgi:hypothetical protein
VPALVQANWLQFLVLPHVVGSSREPSGVKEARWVCAPGWTYELITIRAALPDPGALQQREQRLDGRDHAPRGRRLACLLVYPPLDRPDAQIDLAPAQALDLRAPAHGVAGECIGERVLDLERREQLERRRCPRRRFVAAVQDASATPRAPAHEWLVSPRLSSPEPMGPLPAEAPSIRTVYVLKLQAA